jgi:hypothetical protein
MLRKAACVSALVAAFLVPAAAAPNWSGVPAKDVMLFYPGQSSWEWVLTPSDHPGAEKFRAGKNCAACHIGDEKNMGALLVSGKKNEPTPIPGKPGSIDAKVQFTHDDQNLYVRLVIAEGSQPNAKMDNTDEAKVTMMIEPGTVPEAGRAGCWASCHEDSAGMPAAGGSDRTMYLPKTRAKLSRQGGGDALSPDLAKLKAAGYELEYWQARLSPGARAVAANGIIFDKMEETKPTAVTAEASYASGTWTVVFSRKLNAGAGFIPLAAGKQYTVAFAVHSGHTAKRFHYVSFERTLVLDTGNADFVAAKK